MQDDFKIGDVVVQKSIEEYRKTFGSFLWLPLSYLEKVYKISSIKQCNNMCHNAINNDCNDQFIEKLEDSVTGAQVLFSGGCHLRFSKVKRFSWRKI